MRSMLATFKTADGSEQTIETTGIRIVLDGAPLDLSMVSPQRLELHSRSDDKQMWYQIVVFHSAANAMSIELLKHADKK